MPNYHYLCDKCGYEFETYQSIKDESWTKCLDCGDPSLHRVFHAVPVFSRGSPKTVMQQAERNMKDMGKYELEAKRQEVKEANAKCNNVLADNLPKGAKMGDKTQTQTRPWWRQTDKVDTNLANLAPKVKIEKGKVVHSEPLSAKAMDYIMTGKK